MFGSYKAPLIIILGLLALCPTEHILFSKLLVATIKINILEEVTATKCTHTIVTFTPGEGGGGVALPTVGYMGRLHLKGVPFLSSQYTKRYGKLYISMLFY